MTDPHVAFHQVVLLIVPALLFGGVLSGAIKAPNRQEAPRPILASAYVMALGVAPMYVVGAALLATLGWDVGPTSMVLSSLYILGSVAYIGLSLTRPWHEDIARERTSRWFLVAVVCVLPMTWFSLQVPKLVRAIESIRVAEAAHDAIADSAANATTSLFLRGFENDREGLRLSYLRKEIDRTEYVNALSHVHLAASKQLKQDLEEVLELSKDADHEMEALREAIRE
jgi:hypothetical protein